MTLTETVNKILEHLNELYRLLGATDERKIFDCCTETDDFFEKELYESISKHKAAIITAIEGLEKPDPTQDHVGWIDCKVQMPPPGVRVFFLHKDYGRVGFDTWFGDDFRWTPSHWMPIPPLTTTQPTAQREWVGLADYEIMLLSGYDLNNVALIVEVQRKLKEKNT